MIVGHNQQVRIARRDGWIGRVEHLIVETHPPYGPDALFADLRANGWEFDVLRQIQTSDEHGARSTCFLARSA